MARKMLDPKTRSPRWAFMQVLLIPDWNDPSKIYLKRRRVIQTPWFGFFVHHIYLTDSQRDPHDHPWVFRTFVLRGGYTERLHTIPNVSLNYSYLQFHKRFSWHKMPLDQAHKIVLLNDKTVTLVFVGKRRRSWGFFTRDGFIDWTEYRHAGPDPFNS